MSEPALSLLSTLRRANQLPFGARLLLAVSGGADSLALLHLYTRLYEALGITLIAATFDHGLRGDAGRGDAAYVMELARAWGVECTLGQGNLDPHAPGVEARARAARYAFLADTARTLGAEYVATAHHSDDQAETLLLNLIRGAGSRGLGGMRALSPLPDAPEIMLVRPVLSVRRADLEAYCRSEGIQWREDSTNADVRLRRNWVRLVALPLLSQVNPNLVNTLARTAAVLADEDDFLRQAVKEAAARMSGTDSRQIWVERDAFEAWHPAVQSRMLMEAAARISAEVEPDYAHVRAALALLQGQEGGTVELGKGVEVTADTRFVMVGSGDAPWSSPYPGWWLDGECIQVMSLTMEWPRKDTPQSQLVLAVQVPAGSVMTLRPRRKGDRVYPLGLKGRSQKLKDWLINTKVPRLLRNHLPVITVEDKVVALWNGQDWMGFYPPFEGETIEIAMTIQSPTI